MIKLNRKYVYENLEIRYQKDLINSVFDIEFKVKEYRNLDNNFEFTHIIKVIDLTNNIQFDIFYDISKNTYHTDIHAESFITQILKNFKNKDGNDFESSLIQNFDDNFCFEDLLEDFEDIQETEIERLNQMNDELILHYGLILKTYLNSIKSVLDLKINN